VVCFIGQQCGGKTISKQASEMRAAGVGDACRSHTRTSGASVRIPSAAGVVIALLACGCTTSQSTGEPADTFKRNCAESVYLTGPTFPTCNNF
jgi:hypothetical protein